VTKPASVATFAAAWYLARHPRQQRGLDDVAGAAHRSANGTGVGSYPLGAGNADRLWDFSEALLRRPSLCPGAGSANGMRLWQ
jgi:hypothetical protein